MTDLIPKNATLEHCETIIETNLAGAFAVASALSHIHDHKLYKATHKTWEVYCLERWQDEPVGGVASDCPIPGRGRTASRVLCAIPAESCQAT